MCRSEAEAEEALREVEQRRQADGLTLHPTKTQIINAAENGFDFLGYHFERGKHWPRKKSLQKLKETIRVETRRNKGQSLARMPGRIIQAIRRDGTCQATARMGRWRSPGAI
jgi:RNA-directed DNA polymerase